jgi:hypothetical protein
MRLWSIHPKYLDSIGLVALWREALLAKAVLKNPTSGYANHPQLIRFKNTHNPLAYINSYLVSVFMESVSRGYNFNRQKITPNQTLAPIPVTQGQLNFELQHLKLKLQKRSLQTYLTIKHLTQPTPHPLFTAIPGPLADWEKFVKGV